ncbi:MAG: alpha-1,2-fucosyltransferase [Ichthyobacteriaceae bacterium]|nr:alpha-1,2-fucosyltransferase [Ichthyobacteriaceae bacterium]
MLYVNLYGGIGNQMFQYALVRSISVINKIDFRLDTSSFNNDILRKNSLLHFNIEENIFEDNKEIKHPNNKITEKLYYLFDKYGFPVNDFIKEKEEYVFCSDILNYKKGHLDGYWQSYKYFENIRVELLHDFKLKIGFNSDNKKIFNDIETSNSVSVHIRRGDYLKYNKYNTFGMEYYETAFELIDMKIENPKYFVFSDDISWAKDNLKLNNVVFVDVNSGDEGYNDLILMSNCKHNIIANSSFSWWGAWLNNNLNKFVVTPKKWINGYENFNDLIPETWISL